MIKYYCDRCGKESPRLADVIIPNIKGSLSFEGKTVHLCPDCEKEANDIYNKLTDIRFILFDGFIKGGAE